jgi:hypothetical protein
MRSLVRAAHKTFSTQCDVTISLLPVLIHQSWLHLCINVTYQFHSLKHYARIVHISCGNPAAPFILRDEKLCLPHRANKAEGTTCYSNSPTGGLHCSSPPPGFCYTTGGWCPPSDTAAMQQSSQEYGVTAFCGITPVSIELSMLIPALCGCQLATSQHTKHGHEPTY